MDAAADVTAGEPPAATTAAGWTARGVTYRHPGAARAAVDDVTLDVPPARLTAVLGPNGAGKSTLLALLLGTLRPASGAAAFAGRSLGPPGGTSSGAWPRAALARRVGVVPQGEEFAFPLTVRALVEMGRYPHLGRWEPARAADRAVVDAAIARVGMEPFAERAVGTLSGGERQRARLARALAQVADGPSGSPAPGAALALDEPTAALDLAHEMAFFGLVRALADAGTTVLLVTHNLNLAARYADRLVLMHEGRVAAAGAPADVLTAERVSRVYDWPVEVVPFRHGVGPRADAPDGPARVGAPQVGAPQVVPLTAAGR